MKASMRPLVIAAIELALTRTLNGANSPRKQRTQQMSCCAVYDAAKLLHPQKKEFVWDNSFDTAKVNDIEEAFNDAIEKPGLRDTYAGGTVDVFNAFEEFKTKAERQQARAMWLTWVKTMIEEKVV